MKKCEALMLNNDGDYTRPCPQNAKEEVGGNHYCKRHATFERKAREKGLASVAEMEETRDIEAAEAAGKERIHGN